VSDSQSQFKATLDRCCRKKIALHERSQVDEIIDVLKNEKFIVEKVIRSQRKRQPWAPFTTSSLQQDASSKLGFTSRKTMSIAQQLYEGINIGSGETVGLVTYIRTDSTRVSTQVQEEARAFIAGKYGADFVPDKPPVYKSRTSAQEAHEAIRPTSVGREPELIQQYLTRDQQRLYNLIWSRFLASQMSPAVHDQIRVLINAGNFTFKAVGSTLRFSGFLKLYQIETQEKETILPDMEEQQELTLREFLPEQHFTQPPSRYNEASLIKTLEEKGIGRPSTYSPTIETIQSRGYVIKENKSFVPTELGFVVVALIVSYFPEVIDIDFTANLEQQLDDIEEGKREWLAVIRDFYDGYFKEQLSVAEQKIVKIEIEPEVSDQLCPQCGKQLIYKRGRFGLFLACPGYPDCKYTQKIVKETGVVCPLDGGALVERKTKKGRIFYGCSNYPACNFSLWNKPLSAKCPRCESIMTEVWRGKKKVSRCLNKDCGYEPTMTPRKTVKES
ncbi:MAG TPA: type I DNA topoisomerase, partial [Candidatus Limnocylindrales bacterium]|nr:type I DNA topoisomerase [Candidatus Limnocylindrales bacterium]